jgi:Secretion system C-terminal sorting domain
MRKIKSYIFLLICFFSSLHSYAQRNNIWCFGDSAGIDFNTNPPTTFQSAAGSIKSSVSVCDYSGTLKFYAHSGHNLIGAWAGFNTVIFNRNHEIMLNGDSLYGEGWNGELALVPFPNDTNKYYLFSISITFNNGMHYSVIDMQADSGRGAVILKNQFLLNYTFNEGATVSLHGNGSSYWLLVHKKFANTFVEYLIDSSGISSPIYQTIGKDTRSEASTLIFTKNGEKLIIVEAGGLIQQFDFNRCTGVLSNPNLIRDNVGFIPMFYGVSLSPSDRYLYISNADSYADTSYIWQYDLWASNINASRTVIYAAHIPAAAGNHALAPDGKIYISYIDIAGYFYPVDSVFTLYNQNLSVINYPDSPGVACGLAPFSFNLGGRRTYWGLPINYNYYNTALPGACQPQGLSNKDPMYFTLSPNPAHSYLEIKFEQSIPIDQIIIRSQLGQVIKTFSPEKFSSKLLPINDLSNGLYFLQVVYKEKITTKKFIKD